MRYAIIESGGKQYKAVEGETIEVDRLPAKAGEKIGLERVLMLVDGEDVTVGTPTIGDLLVNTTVMDHFKGPKLTTFKYSPKKRIRVKGGHRQQYTRLMVDVIGKPGETRKAAKAETSEAPVEEAIPAPSPKAKKPAAKETKAEKAPATASPKGKKTTTKKTTEKASSTKTKK
jgi:large subunit ribosomal protein L21